MKSKIIMWVVVAFVVLLSIVTLQFSMISKAYDKIDRLSGNFTELMQENKQLRFTVEEFEEYSTNRMDSILKVANVKPKWVKEYTVINHNYYDTTIVEVPVEKVDTFTYSFLDSRDCFTVGGTVSIKDTVPIISIDYREFSDTLNIIKYLYPKKFLFFRSYLFGKTEGLEIVGNCGTYNYEHIQIVKN